MYSRCYALQSLIFDTALCGNGLGGKFVEACKALGKKGCDLTDPKLVSHRHRSAPPLISFHAACLV
jgi:hypothetical protein